MKESTQNKKKQSKMKYNSSSEDSVSSNNSFILKKTKMKRGMNMRERMQQKSDIKFHKMIFKLMTYNQKKIIESKVFKLGVEVITSKSLSEDIPYTSE